MGKWDLIVAFPPCTHLAGSGAAWYQGKYLDGRQWDGIQFFAEFLNADCDHIAIENPVGIISGNYIPKTYPKLAKRWGFPRQYTQAIQPYQFGSHARKKTCLWLKGLPKLIPTDIVDMGEVHKIHGKAYSHGASADYAVDENGKILAWNDPRTAIIRSKTFPGIAKAMAEQWGDYLLGLENDYHNDSMIDNSNEVKGQMALSDYDGWEL